MAHLGLRPPKARSAARAEDFDHGRLEDLLPEAISAILRPHLAAALSAYPDRERPAVLAAYGVACLVLADLLSQNKALEGWRDAGARALCLLARRCEPAEPAAPDEARRALRAAEDLIEEMNAGAALRSIGPMMDQAIREMSDRKTSGRGSVTLRAALARLEALALASKSALGLAA